MERQCSNDVQHLVLVSVVQNANEVERSLKGIRGVVRLTLREECLSARNHTADSPLTVVVPSWQSLKDGELRLSIGGVASGETPSDEVKCGSKAVDTVADFKGPIGSRDVWGVVESYDATSVRWFLDNDSIGFEIEKGGDVALEAVEMMLRPTKLGAAVIESHAEGALNAKDAQLKQKLR